MTRHAFGAKLPPGRHTTPATLESGARAQGSRTDGRSAGGGCGVEKVAR